MEHLCSWESGSGPPLGSEIEIVENTILRLKETAKKEEGNNIHDFEMMKRILFYSYQRCLDIKLGAQPHPQILGLYVESILLCNDILLNYTSKIIAIFQFGDQVNTKELIFLSNIAFEISSCLSDLLCTGRGVSEFFEIFDLNDIAVSCFLLQCMVIMSNKNHRSINVITKLLQDWPIASSICAQSTKKNTNKELLKMVFLLFLNSYETDICLGICGSLSFQLAIDKYGMNSKSIYNEHVKVCKHVFIQLFEAFDLVFDQINIDKMILMDRMIATFGTVSRSGIPTQVNPYIRSAGIIVMFFLYWASYRYNGNAPEFKVAFEIIAGYQPLFCVERMAYCLGISTILQLFKKKSANLNCFFPEELVASILRVSVHLISEVSMMDDNIELFFTLAWIKAESINVKTSMFCLYNLLSPENKNILIKQLNHRIIHGRKILHFTNKDVVFGLYTNTHKFLESKNKMDIIYFIDAIALLFIEKALQLEQISIPAIASSTNDILSILSLVSPKQEEFKSNIVSNINKLVFDGLISFDTILASIPTIEEVISSSSLDNIDKPTIQMIQNNLNIYLDLELGDFSNRRFPTSSMVNESWIQNPIIGHTLYFYLYFIDSEWISYIAMYNQDFFLNNFIRMGLLSLHQIGYQKCSNLAFSVFRKILASPNDFKLAIHDIAFKQENGQHESITGSLACLFFREVVCSYPVAMNNRSLANSFGLVIGLFSNTVQRHVVFYCIDVLKLRCFQLMIQDPMLLLDSTRDIFSLLIQLLSVGTDEIMAHTMIAIKEILFAMEIGLSRSNAFAILHEGITNDINNERRNRLVKWYMKLTIDHSRL